MAAISATLAAVEPSAATKSLENTSKRDALIEMEKKYQAQWEQGKIFHANAPTDPSERKREKFFGTMAYPYVNGSLHLGHAFTASKVEFAAGWARLKGLNVLYPQGYHATGMPIKACADKIKREIELFGQNFEGCSLDDVATSDAPSTGAPSEEREDITKFKAGKSKSAAKVNVALKYQFQIMLGQGIPLEEIHKFSDPLYWLQYFPPIVKRDLSDFGARIDWRRSFITTDANPYYDSFVRWQIQKLRDLGKIKFGKRYTIYSPKDGQACMDHDRAEGEGVGVQEYTGIKLKVTEWPESLKQQTSSYSNVFMVPATLRPETMYGQICVFVGPTITYGLYKVSGNEYFLMTPRAARNAAYQNLTPKWGEIEEVAQFKGSELIGTKVSAPLSLVDSFYVLPMETVKASKGTGFVACVPSDSPDDYATVLELRKKPDYYRIKPEWIEADIIPVIETPTYGNLTAKAVVEQLKINSPKDAKLAEAKEIAYKEGFYKGKMLVGDFKGESVATAKDKITQVLLDAGDAFRYAEPEGEVISRSGDECVAGHLDQWYLNYGAAEKGGDGEWQQTVIKHIQESLQTFTNETKNALEASLNWLGQWACARSYGLGTKMPFADSELVESLSDSTIYMAYYTIAHILHEDYFGQRPSNGITADQMTSEVWDYVFVRSETLPTSSGISETLLKKMRDEFTYWYPLDFRCSGKDLITNHLTFFLYIHVALFKQQYWPRGVRINGHLQLNGAKMSKSKGNFLTLHDSIKKFGATATRIALADAGDGLDDANFAESVANNTILRMYELRLWLENMVKDAKPVSSASEYRKLRDSSDKLWIDGIQRTGDDRGFWDRIFEDELNGLAKETREAYERHEYKAALKAGLYDFTSARDAYRETCKAAGIGMHQSLIRHYAKLQALMIEVVAPHYSEYIWQDILGEKDSIQHATFPPTPAQDPFLIAAREYVRATSSSITSAEGNMMKKAAKGKSTAYDPKNPKVLSIFAASSFPQWQDDLVEIVRKNFDGMQVDVKAIAASLPRGPHAKKAMPYVQLLKKRLEGGEESAQVFNRKLPFDEAEILREMIPGLLQTINKCVRVEVVWLEEGGKAGTVIHAGGDDAKEGEHRSELPPQAEAAEPGRPQFAFANV